MTADAIHCHKATAKVIETLFNDAFKEDFKGIDADEHDKNRLLKRERKCKLDF